MPSMKKVNKRERDVPKGNREKTENLVPVFVLAIRKIRRKSFMMEKLS